MAKPGQQTWLFGRVRIDRPAERIREAVSDAAEKRGHQREADGLDAAARRIKDPAKRAKAQRAAKAYRRKHC